MVQYGGVWYSVVEYGTGLVLNFMTIFSLPFQGGNFCKERTYLLFDSMEEDGVQRNCQTYAAMLFLSARYIQFLTNSLLRLEIVGKKACGETKVPCSYMKEF